MAKTPWTKLMQQMFRYEDADPAHVAFCRADVPEDVLHRTLLAWMAFYHVGVASMLGQYGGSKFWRKMFEAYPTAPRSTERRHFRGQSGLAALKDWVEWYPDPAYMFAAIRSLPPRYTAIREYMRRHAQFGDYFVWKVCDLYEAMGGDAIDMDGCERYVSASAAKGARKIGQAMDGTLTVMNVLERVAIYGRAHGLTSPPLHRKTVTVLDAETVCCVYKQLRGGKYVPGIRTASTMMEFEELPSALGNVYLAAMLAKSKLGYKGLKSAWDQCNALPYDKALAKARKKRNGWSI